MAMQIIYAYHINNSVDADAIMAMIKNDNPKLKYSKAFVNELTSGVIANLEKIDFYISLNLTDYTLDRISLVDRSMLEVATYELLFTDCPGNIVIDESIEIAKEYSELEDYKTSRFNNAVLDKIYRSIKHE